MISSISSISSFSSSQIFDDCSKLCDASNLSVFIRQDPLNILRIELVRALNYYDTFKDMEDGIPAWVPSGQSDNINSNSNSNSNRENIIMMFDDIVDLIYEELIVASELIVTIMEKIKGTPIEKENIGIQGADALRRIYNRL